MSRVDSTTAATDADTEARRAGSGRAAQTCGCLRGISEKYLSGQSAASSCKPGIHVDKDDTGLSAFKLPLQSLTTHFDAPRDHSTKSEGGTC